MTSILSGIFLNCTARVWGWDEDRPYCSEDSGESWRAWGEWTPVENTGAIALDRRLENGRTYWFQRIWTLVVLRTNLREVSVGENGLPQSRSLSGDRDDSHRGDRPARPSEDSGADGSDLNGIRLTESADRAPAPSQALPAAELASSQAQTLQSASAEPDHARDPACSPPGFAGGFAPASLVCPHPAPPIRRYKAALRL